MNTKHKIWDPFVRIFHWTVVTGVALNALFLDPESKLHRQVGYVVAGMFALRIIWGFVGSRYARFSSFPPDVSASIQQASDMVAGRKVAHLGHTPLGALMIYNIIVTIAVIAGSGYAMTTDMFWGVKLPQQIHEVAVTWLEISVVAHIAAVVLESLRTRVNLPKAMVTGHKHVPQEVKVID